jgi:predicted kinase
MKGHLHIVFGLPRSGKSTFCDQLVRKTDNQPRVIIAGDDIRKALTGERYNDLAEGFVRSIKYTMVRALFNRGHYIILDGTYTKIYNWRELFQVDKDLEYTFIDTEVSECIRRAILTQQDDLIPVIQKMADNLIQWNNGMGDYKYNLEGLRNQYK